MAEEEYKVMLIDRTVEATQFIFDKIDEQLNIFKASYATEMSIMNEQPLQMFEFDDDQICVAFTKEFMLLGFLSFGFNPRNKVLFIEHVYVNPSFRKKGIYTTMLKRIEKLAKDIHADKIASFVYIRNNESMAAHLKLGFKHTMMGCFKEVDYGN